MTAGFHSSLRGLSFSLKKFRRAWNQEKGLEEQRKALNRDMDETEIGLGLESVE